MDTGSSLLEISCQSEAAQANCGGQALSSSYELTPASTVTSAAVCASTGVDCFVPGSEGEDGVCYFSQGVSAVLPSTCMEGKLPLCTCTCGPNLPSLPGHTGLPATLRVVAP